MPELIELSRNELLRVAMQARDERDAVIEALTESSVKSLALALKLRDTRRKMNIYWGFFCLTAILALGLAIILLVKSRQSTCPVYLSQPGPAVWISQNQ